MSSPPGTTAMPDAPSSLNPLLSTQSRSELQVILHPLVLLTISDYITRHTLRNQQSPIVGGLLGLQNGREITIEHAFDCDMTAEGAEYRLNTAWFETRLDQMKQVHQDRHLEFVGWYTLVPSSGPSATILPIQQVFQQYNESAILLAFHPDVVHGQATGSKLPLTIYESILEVKGLSAVKTDLQDTEDKPMEDGDGRPQTKFRQVPYSVEVDETEMISLNYVASTSANAASLSTAKDEKVSRSVESNGKGKRRLVESAEADQVQKDNQDLTTEEEETIAFITMKSNAIKMLQSRIELVKTYLENLPPSFVAPGAKLDDLMDTDSTTPSNKILRQIQALVSRLDLIVPADKESFEREVFDETNDASLIILLNQVVQSANDARNAGKKTHVVETARAMSQRRTTSGLDLPVGQADLSSLGAGDIMM